MFPTFRVLRRRGDGLHPMFVRAVPADDCCRGGRCPLTIAAALGHDGIGSGSDPIPWFVRGGGMFPTFRVLRRRGDGLHPMFVRAVPADDCCRGGRCPLTIAAALGHDGIGSGSDPIPWFVRGGGMFPTFRVLRRRGDGLHPMFVRRVAADDCCRDWLRRF